MNIDKDIIGKPPNEAIVINEQLIKRAKTYEQVSDQEECDNYRTVETETSQVPESDSREKLEADICDWLTRDLQGNPLYEVFADSVEPGSMPEIRRWLDRQAAITHELDNVWARAQQTRITELTAERDYLQKVVQMVIAPVATCDFLEVDELSETERGAGGFGSSGLE